MCGIDVWPQIYWTNKLKYTSIKNVQYVNTHKIVGYMVHNFSIFFIFVSYLGFST
jgi:hypothetical protein